MELGCETDLFQPLVLQTFQCHGSLLKHGIFELTMKYVSSVGIATCMVTDSIVILETNWVGVNTKFTI